MANGSGYRLAKLLTRCSYSVCSAALCRCVIRFVGVRSQGNAAMQHTAGELHRLVFGQGMHCASVSVLCFVTFSCVLFRSLSLSVSRLVHICISICFIRSFKAALHLQLLQMLLYTFQRALESRAKCAFFSRLLHAECVLAICTVCVIVFGVSSPRKCRRLGLFFGVLSGVFC